jgi:hypothetical protein
MASCRFPSNQSNEHRYTWSSCHWLNVASAPPCVHASKTR